MGVKATQPEGSSSENDLNNGNGNVKGAEGQEGIEEKIQDVLVPWVLRSKPKPKPKSKPKSKSKPTSTPLSNDNEDQNETTNNDPVDEKDEGQEVEKEEEKEEEEEEKVFNRYYHLFIEGELRDLIHQAGVEEGYRILSTMSAPPSLSSSPPASSSPLPSSTSTSTSATSAENDQKEINGESGDGKWLRIRGEGWEADNWWVEAEVGVGDGQ